MSFFAHHSSLFAPLFNDPAIIALFSDEQFIRYLLATEASLATVQSRLDLIPSSAGEQISIAASTLQIDWQRLQQATEQAGFPIIELVRQLRVATSNEAAAFVHWGATTQDIMDTALILQLRAALDLIEAKLRSVIGDLAQLANRHRHTLMAGRTHSQQALPITFGLKVANWLAPLLRHLERLEEIKPRLLVVQLGGAAGTLAALGEMGMAVQAALAAELGLAVPLMPWHTQRDTLAELAGWLSLVTGSLAKLAQDVILLAQSEVGEVNESADRARGGSSTMPQKSNPIVSELIVALARSNANLLASMHQALIQEHERATHGWQLEWLTLPQMVAQTAAALNKASFLSQNMVVDEAQMRKNVAASNGLMLAEALSFALAGPMDRTTAKRLIGAAVEVARGEKRHLVDVVREQCAAPLDWAMLRNEANYLGSTQALIDRVLQKAAA